MPQMIIDGESKKVACGPCIRGHRSSKCRHNDRLMIEVRKPGRPLSACPHASGSCNCVRAVTYAVPRGNQGLPVQLRSVPVQLAGVAVPPRKQRPKGKRNGSTVTPSAVQLGLDGLDSAAFTSHIPGLTQHGSSASSNVPSLGSSNASTPQLNAIDGGPIQRKDSSRPSLEKMDEERQELQAGMMNGEPYAPWTDGGQLSNCCETEPTSSEPAQMHPSSSCCAPKPPGSNETAGQAHQDASHNAFGHGANYGQLNDPSPLPNTQFDNFGDGLAPFPFSEYENRRGCSTSGQPSSHIHGSECSCGDGCNCFACSTHPATKATQKYVLASYISQYSPQAFHPQPTALRSRAQLSQPPYQEGLCMSSMPATSATVPILQQNPFSPTIPDWNAPTQSYGTSQGVLQHTMPAAAGTSAPYSFEYSMGSTPHNNMLSSRQVVYEDQLDGSNRLSNFSPATATELPPTSNQDAETANNYESPNTDQDDDVSTLSASHFQIQQLAMPGCDDISGGCACGDGSSCFSCALQQGQASQFGIMNESSAGPSNDHAYRMSPLDHLQDTNGFDLSEVLSPAINLQ
ncbi:hypothetical protein FKW77_008566 [Venturia effusa]|uniref:Copper-fist domain-containing protein n=1 Tax=Venturia effusa TaxID=50376 RepID=A0A517LKQ0_9PEZI|nr:hypothetical protein FKW77_008566 [Venturia effusa]